MRKSRLLLVLVAVALIIFGLIYILDPTSLPVDNDSEDKAFIEFPNGQIVTADIADDEVSRNTGLSNREQIGEYEGLLFLHETKDQHSYWMKDMLFAIDIIWIDGDIVTGFSENIPPENPASTIYSPEVPVNHVLEVQAGFVDEIGLLVGDQLDIQLPEQ
tara:strand:- start:236 stop:715 length:480 start_codon:yes stop_codon:yes gene_type:complete